MEKIPRQQSSDIIRIVLFGPESTGKTTLSRKLAAYYDTVWVPEYAREYLQKKWDEEGKICEQKDIIPIAIGQINLENKIIQKAKDVIFCDTDLLETKVYSEEYYDGFVTPELQEASLANTYDLYLLTYIDTPWEADDLRDRPEQRLEMFQAFEQALIERKVSYITLKGNVNVRLQTAITAIDKLLLAQKNKTTILD